MDVRVTDFALIIGHVWRCTSCRKELLKQPSLLWVGYKLSEEQRACIVKLDDDDFHTVMHLATVTGLTTKEIDAAIDHPRARLRHLGSIRSDARSSISR